MNLVKIESILNPNHDEIQIVTSDLSHNPYALNNEKDVDQIARQSKNMGFVDIVKDSEYYYYLKKVYAFWNSFLPKLSKMLEQERQFRREEASEQELLLENASPKYKHAFFSMLTLVCLLLAILCVCVYILKKSDGNMSGSILWRKFFRLFDRKPVVMADTTSSLNTSANFIIEKKPESRMSTEKKIHVLKVPMNEKPEDLQWEETDRIEIRNWRYHLTSNHF